MAAKTTKVDRSTLPPTFDRLKSKKRIEQTVTVYLDDDSVTEFTRAQDALEQARTRADVTLRLIDADTNRPDDVKAAARAAHTADTAASLKKLQADVDKAESSVREASVTCLFRSIGRARYDELLREYPPTDEEVAEAKEKGEQPPAYHFETFGPALIAEACVSPQMTPEQVSELWDEWNATEIAELWAAAVAVNSKRRVVELGKAHG